MNIILDTLFLRKPRIEYVSPPICEATILASGSGESIMTSADMDQVLIDLGE
jgi:hypothetical protein